jgi:hypothetical protein
MEPTRLICLLCGLGVMAWAFIRWKSTPRFDPERVSRRDMAMLLALFNLGLAGDLLRTRWPERSTGFLLISLLLLPVAGGALYLLIRLLRAYRRPEAPRRRSDEKQSIWRGRRG